MSGLWWLQPGWSDARCGNCGGHIQRSGGDPDWGLCWPCMQNRVNRSEQDRYDAKAEQEYYEQMQQEQEREAMTTPDAGQRLIEDLRA